MAINPVAYTEKVISGFLRYQLTAYPLADQRLSRQMRQLLSIDATRKSPLLRGPYISLSRAFRPGAAVRQLVDEGLLHPLLASLHPHDRLYGHQEEAIRAIAAGQTTLVSTGTGSGKTECFLYPIISHCLNLRDQGAPAGITAVLVYPMNALAEDQIGRLRALLAGSGVTFGLYVGSTPRAETDVASQRLDAGSSRQDYAAALARAQATFQTTAVNPPEERCSREAMRTSGQQPRILLTNVKQLELLLTRQADVDLFDDARLDFLVFDEAHTFSGAAGAETACLIRRLRSFCGRTADETVCVATSATLVDPDGGDAPGRAFAARFFGVDPAAVHVVGESHAEDDWSRVRAPSPAPPGDPTVHLQAVLAAVDADDPAAIQAAWQAMTGEPLWDDWRHDLYRRMAANDLVYQLTETLAEPRPLDSTLDDLSRRVGRPVAEAELLTWLVLGAAARNAGRPLLRPIVHAFTRGLGGAIVTFPAGAAEPRLWLSAEDEAAARTDVPLARLPLTTCTTCGQHYFVHTVQDFTFDGDTPGGGVAVDDRWYWPALDALNGGSRLVLFDRFAGLADDRAAADPGDDPDAPDEPDIPRRSAPVHLCRHCGALHPLPRPRCDACTRSGPLVPLLAAPQKTDPPGHLTACLSCGSRGRSMGARYREPARELRAVAVSDVHILAQDMLRHAERPRLLVFADNRQDAAFQAGWMRDHARRYRLRALMDQALRDRPQSVGDLAATLDERLAADDELSRTLVPEVWAVHLPEKAGHRHEDERRRYLRIQVLREVTTAFRQRIGLEPWGRMIVQYHGLEPGLPFFQTWAPLAGLPPAELREGVAGLLDQIRRKSIVHDPQDHLFGRFWRDGDFEVQRGYFPVLQGVPKGVKLRRAAADDRTRLDHWLSTKGETTARQHAARWGIPPERVDDCLTELWRVLTADLGILTPVTLKGSGATPKPLPNCTGAYQLDAGHLVLAAHEGQWRCDRCRRATPRGAPRQRCTAWRCDGRLVHQLEDPDNYDLLLLRDDTGMLRPHEHSAQVPHAVRETIERAFKGHGDAVNTLVCTPTLELGVDIGDLDAVLMRNVPPQAANYWQRVGRAGRRMRMAVNLTYARPVSHDRAYFADPLKLLGGHVEPPRFNLRNDLMVARHVHAAVLTGLHQAARREGPPSPTLAVLERAFPAWVRGYLFDESGAVLPALPDLAPLRDLIQSHRVALLDSVTAAFRQGWPAAEAEGVGPQRLGALIDGMADDLGAVLGRLRRRLDWARDQMQRLDEVRRRKGALDPDEKAHFDRCERLVRRLKGTDRQRRRAAAEPDDDTYTYGLLAAEGFLPGYGLETGAIRALADLRPPLGDAFVLSRPPTLALRELVPGNLLYANGHRFVAGNYQLEVVDAASGARAQACFAVDPAHEAVTEVGQAPAGGVAPLAAHELRAVPICDVDLQHRSQISDNEDFRFQLPVAVYGLRREQHGGGAAHRWGEVAVQHLRGARFRLVNVGPALAHAVPGYPLCLVCGYCASPLSSAKEREHFAQKHLERCGQPVQPTGFYADIAADAMVLPDVADRTQAYSVLEALRIGASRVLEMERDDLEVLVIGLAGQDAVEAVLYDPMPGGSGLLDQLVGRFPEVLAAARDVVASCPSACERACVDCLLSFENGFFHRHLDRTVAAERFAAWGPELAFEHLVPPRLPSPPADHAGLPVNRAEAALRDDLAKAGFPAPIWHHRIDLGSGFGWTEPDGFYPGEDDEPGICIYLDGLSRHLHGNPATAERDRVLRDRLKAMDYRVLVIAASDLFDRAEMAAKLKRLARWLMLGNGHAEQLAADPSWFQPPEVAGTGGDDPPAGDPWSEALALLDARWRPLAEGLRHRGLPPPEIDFDVAVRGFTTGEVATMAWPTDAGAVLLHDRPVGDASTRVVVSVPDAPADDVARRLRAMLEG
ncbi:MAG: DUF1998 domain-containing protein [Chloroflexi bacterium CFX6]|nr:DUF1998 domain-containing protein [Chloroflexi bacterium CFX6]